MGQPLGSILASWDRLPSLVCCQDGCLGLPTQYLGPSCLGNVDLDPQAPGGGGQGQSSLAPSLG